MVSWPPSLPEIGSIASITGILLTVVIAVYRNRDQLRWPFLRSIPLERFWGDFLQEKQYMVTPPEDRTERMHGTHSLDYRGSWELIEKLRSVCGGSNVEYELVEADDLAAEQKRQNLILVGAPGANELTKVALSEDPEYYNFIYRDGKYRQTILNHQKPSQSFGLVKDGDGGVVRDFGVVARLPNPYNRSNDVIIVAGGYGWGTQAACRTLADDDQLDYLLSESSTYFQAICVVDIDEDGVGQEPVLVDCHPDSSFREKTLISID